MINAIAKPILLKLRERMLLSVMAMAIVAVVLVARATSRSGDETPFVPRSDSDVLDVLPFQASDPTVRRLAAMRRRLQADPNNLDLASQVAELNIEIGRDRGDPRYLGYAQAALTPWWNLPHPPMQALLLRATIRQSAHDFDGALADIDEVLATNPDEPQAWLTRAVILTVRGDYAEAKKSCETLVPLSAPLVSEVCFSTLESLQGQAKHAYTRLSHAIGSGRYATAEEAWAVSTLGEIATRAGDLAAAERHFRRALALEPTSAYVLGVYADLLLDQGRSLDAIELLRRETQNDALLLRLAIAESREGAPPAKEHVETLRQRFEASHLRGDTVHRREESRFELQLNRRPKAALKLAEANWDVQREPWDARVYLEAALAMRDPQSANSAIAAMQKSRLEEPKIVELLGNLGSIGR